MNIYACCMLFNAVGRPGNRAPPFPPRYNNSLIITTKSLKSMVSHEQRIIRKASSKY